MNKDTEMLPIKSYEDPRGCLLAVESETDVPFRILRTFFISNVPSGAKRGEHAYLHYEFVVCVKGSCKIDVFDGNEPKSFQLDNINTGLLIPPKTWRTLYSFSADCIIAVLSDAHYNPADYIYSFDDFMDFKANCDSSKR